MQKKELLEKRNDLQDKLEEIIANAKAENRAVTEEEEKLFNAYESELKIVNELFKKTEDHSMKPVENMAEVKSFENYLRGIVDQDAPMQKSDNGALIPTTIVNKIIDKVEEISPIYQLAEKYNIKGKVTIPYVNSSASTLTMDYATEFTTPDAGSLKTASIELSGFLAEALCKVSKSLINNSSFDIVEFVVNHIATLVAKFLDKELLVGTSTKIEGLSGATLNVTAAAQTAVTADELIDLQETVIDEYQENAVWIMSRATRKAIRKLKDGNGNYLLEKDSTAKWNYTLMGKPVYVSSSMPDMEKEKVAIYYGDMSGLAVKIGEGISTQILSELYATEHAVGVVAFVEVDAKVQDAQKIAKLTMANA